jgi:hypothetical protein
LRPYATNGPSSFGVDAVAQRDQAHVDRDALDDRAHRVVDGGAEIGGVVVRLDQQLRQLILAVRAGEEHRQRRTAQGALRQRA